jgi:hypothetical protein
MLLHVTHRYPHISKRIIEVQLRSVSLIHKIGIYPSLRKHCEQHMDAVGMVQLASLEALSKAQSDAELKYQAKALNAVLRIGSDASVFDFFFVGDGVSEVRAAAGEAAVSKLGNDELWTTALQLRDGGPVPGYESLTMAQTSGLKTTGDFLGVIAPYQAALQRLILFFLENRPLARRPFVETFRDTDTAVGRYILVKANGAEARMYYGEAGTGKIPLLCQATAGADSRRSRYMLADPEMQGASV